jgi:hypothetical protein
VLSLGHPKRVRGGSIVLNSCVNAVTTAITEPIQIPDVLVLKHPLGAPLWPSGHATPKELTE